MAQGYVDDSTCGRIAIAKLLTLPTSTSPNLRPASQPCTPMMKATHPSNVHHVASNNPKPSTSTSSFHQLPPRSSSYREDEREIVDDLPSKRTRYESIVVNGGNHTIYFGSSNYHQPQTYAKPIVDSDTARLPSDTESHGSHLPMRSPSFTTNMPVMADTYMDEILHPIPISSTSMDTYSQYEDM